MWAAGELPDPNIPPPVSRGASDGCWYLYFTAWCCLFFACCGHRAPVHSPVIFPRSAATAAALHRSSQCEQCELARDFEDLHGLQRALLSMHRDDPGAGASDADEQSGPAIYPGIRGIDVDV